MPLVSMAAGLRAVTFIVSLSGQSLGTNQGTVLGYLLALYYRTMLFPQELTWSPNLFSSPSLPVLWVISVLNFLLPT